MSHNYPHRQLPSDPNLRPDMGSFKPADHRHDSPAHDDFNRPAQEPPSSFASSYATSSSTGNSQASHWTMDGALNILNSCGLEPSDLSVLAELPENVLTVESLPHVLKQIKGKRGTVKPFPPSAPLSSSSFPHSSTHQHTARDDRHPLSSTPLQYSSLDPVSHSPLPSDKVQDWQDHWQNTRTVTSSPFLPSTSRPDPPPSSFSSLVVDYGHKPASSEYGTTSAAMVPAPECPTSSVKPAVPSVFSQLGPTDYRPAVPSDVYKPKKQADFYPPGPEASVISKKTNSHWDTKAASVSTGDMPSMKEAQDFHGTSPTVFPYSCSLCDITVLSERTWNQHVNATGHADRQLNLLQKFPKWDCRMETIRRTDNHSNKRKDEGKPASQDHMQKPKRETQIKTTGKGNVVCVNFPNRSVDEPHLRRLTEPFGKIKRITVFPSLGFVELASADQANDVVKYYSSCPQTVEGQKIEFSISKTFNVQQSSKVVSFWPAPLGKNGCSDLLSICRRFGQPVYNLFLPSVAFVEMSNISEAQRLVDHYSSNNLKLNDTVIRVSFSIEYRTLLNCSTAKRCDDEPPSSTKRPRSSSRDREEKLSTKRQMIRSKGREDDRKSRRSRSREKSSKDERRSRSQEKSSKDERKRSRSREKSSKDEKKRSTTEEKSSKDEKKSTTEEKSSKDEKKSTTEEKSSKDEKKSTTEEKSSKDEKKSTTEEKSTKKTSPENKSKKETRSRSVEKTVAAETTTKIETKVQHHRDAKPEAAEKDVTEEGATSSEEEGDIEGMEVIGEDLMEVSDEVEAAEVNSDSANEKRSKVKDKEEEPDFPFDRNNCITLDELSEDEDVRHEKKFGSRVLLITGLPSFSFSDTEFIEIVKDYGKAERYYIARYSRLGFIQMSNPSEAQKAIEDASCRTVFFHGYKIYINLSKKYRYLLNGFDVSSFKDKGKEETTHRTRRRSTRSNETSESEKSKETTRKTQKREASSKKTEKKDESANKKSAEKETASKKTEKKDDSDNKKSTETEDSNRKKFTEKETASKKTEKKDTENKKSEEKDHSKKTTEKDTTNEMSTEKELSQKSLDEESASGNLPTEELIPRTSPENGSVSEMSPEKQPVSKSPPEESPANPTCGELEVVSEKPQGEPTSTKLPTKESRSKKSPEEDSGSKTTSDKTSECLKMKPSSEVSSEPHSKQTEQDSAIGNTSEQTPEVDVRPSNACPKKKTRGAKRKATQRRKKAVVPVKKPKDESANGTEAMDTEDEVSSQTDQDQKPPVCSEVVGSTPSAPPGDLQTEQVTAEPAEGAAEEQKPSKPVGTEFVRPVVGYFCNLCQVIYANEDEAKLQHCSSLEHYNKYQEQTGKDPWTS